jgi:hypothetical protein
MLREEMSEAPILDALDRLRLGVHPMQSFWALDGPPGQEADELPEQLSHPPPGCLPAQLPTAWGSSPASAGGPAHEDALRMPSLEARNIIDSPRSPWGPTSGRALQNALRSLWWHLSCYRSAGFAMATASPDRLSDAELARQVDELIDECRSASLWYQRPDYYPRSRADRLRVLDAIQRHADRDTFIRAGRLKEWLSRSSSDASADS